MFKQLLIVSALSLITQLLIGQTISGMVYETDGEGIPYVNIGVVNRGIGTVSDAMGNYRLNIDSAKINDTLMLSSLGYKPIKIAVSELRKEAQPLDFLMEQEFISLNEVTIIPKKVTPVILGNTFKSPGIQAGFTSDDLGSEAGTLMKTRKNRKYYLKTAGFYVAKCEYDSILFRLNVYDYSKGEIGENLLPRPVYVLVRKGDFHKQINLNDYYIETENDFVVTLEWIEDLADKQEQFMFCTGLMGGGILWRKTSQDAFRKLSGFGVSIYCEADLEVID